MRVAQSSSIEPANGRGSEAIGGAARVKFYARVFSYFRRDVAVIGGLVVLIHCTLFLGFFLPLPVAILVDGYLTRSPQPIGDDWMKQLLI